MAFLDCSLKQTQLNVAGIHHIFAFFLPTRRPRIDNARANGSWIKIHFVQSMKMYVRLTDANDPPHFTVLLCASACMTVTDLHKSFPTKPVLSKLDAECLPPVMAMSTLVDLN